MQVDRSKCCNSDTYVFAEDYVGPEGSHYKEDRYCSKCHKILEMIPPDKYVIDGGCKQFNKKAFH